MRVEDRVIAAQRWSGRRWGCGCCLAAWHGPFKLRDLQKTRFTISRDLAARDKHLRTSLRGSISDGIMLISVIWTRQLLYPTIYVYFVTVIFILAQVEDQQPETTAAGFRVFNAAA